MKTWLGQITVIACVWNLTGCNFHQQIAQDALAYNMTVETVSNQQLLLNIIRSKERRPMYFTALTQIRGSLSGSVSASGTFPFGSDADSKYPITTGGTYSSKPSFDLAILDSQEFMRGIMQPIEMELLKYYWDQGWPPELLLYLFVRKVEWKDDDDKVHQIVNYPADAKKFVEFRIFAKVFSQATFESVSKLEDLGGPPLDGSNGDLKKQLDVQKENYAIEKDGGAYVLRRRANTFELALESRLKLNDEELERVEFTDRWVSFFSKATLAGDHLPQAVKFSLPESVGKLGDETKDYERKGNVKKGKQAAIYLRSPEAVLYYLGELSRKIIDDPKFLIPSIVPSDRQWESGHDPAWPIFYLINGSANSAQAVVSITYDGNSYAIPDAGAGRSLHCFALLTQIIALHKSSDELPTTETVTIVGQ